MKDFTPKQIVDELDKYVIGQEQAKKAVAVALRNRWRRKHIADEIKDEVTPHNILMVGPTGVGKTEIARRLAKLLKSPFIKIEATKFTEVGYVGRDVDSIIRDLLDITIKMVREDFSDEVKSTALQAAKLRLVDCLVGKDASEETKKLYLEKLNSKELDERDVEISITEPTNKQQNIPTFDIPGMPGGQMGMFNLGDLLNKTMGTKNQKLVKLKVSEAMKHLVAQETDNLIDEQSIIDKAIKMTEEDGIVFLDEIDKIASGNVNKRSEVNREGVQRDLLPLIEGTAISTKYGMVKTNHILFIASGAFHLARPSDLLPELQGRLPVRVELHPLTQEDLVRILKEPKNSLPKQYTALFETEKVALEFTESGLNSIAKYAIHINEEVENIGARRLHTLFEKILENISFNADENAGNKFVVDEAFVEKNLADINKQDDLAKFIL
ncbi:ATP-dependent protease ATPase subunit HslU [Candidatus Bandiella euplotis]|uniref:ATP-dependent protease ATPase subunit HslU n=1 Tax=Candidatus Bandiella euplotis TaxID=1664265 RepID=A0ABZ0URB2_9RICK|nr:ATP-dependent protease ATPase subunit HslU [Candidatus Bandiella woodruffii]WPX96560.1 ATP-dependent protease ATPase subunit HslU [Candidatus Bandiella woodruffii]